MSIGEEDMWRERNIKLKHLIIELQELEQFCAEERIQDISCDDNRGLLFITFNNGIKQTVTKKEMSRMIK